ncbi:MAG: GDP-mannose 4,6-dehydratase [Thermodesulfobacteriota bacterium]
MRVLVFGVTGFAGRYLARELVRLGHEVWGAARRPGSAPGSRHPVALDRVRLLRCDVGDPDEVRDALAAAQPDAVVMLAGLSSPPEANRRPQDAYRAHVGGTVNVLSAVATAQRAKRVLAVTSSEVYGRTGRDASPLTEEAPLHPTSIYAASKAAADLAAEAFAVSQGCDVVCVRPFNHTGPGQRADFVCPDFATQVAEIALGRRAPVMEVGNLDVRRDFSDVRDVVRGYVAALVHGRRGETYNLCSGRATSVREILTTLCELADIRPEVRAAAARQRPAEVPAYWGSARKAELELGWRPEIPLRETLRDLLAFSRNS